MSKEDFEAGYKKAFGDNKPVQRGSWIWDSRINKLVTRDEYNAPVEKSYAAVHGDIESFVSPISGEVISDRKQLREHNRRHGVTDMRDYSQSFLDQKKQQRDSTISGQNEQAKSERIALIQETLHKHGL